MTDTSAAERVGTTRVRVRYAETDRMGVVYYANYLVWFEVGRTDLLRASGWNYRDMEMEGFGLPVIEAHCTYRESAKYDDDIDVRTTGEIRILDKNIYDADVSLIQLRKSVGMVFQRPNPLPLSIYENVVFGLRIHGSKQELTKPKLDEAVERALAEVGLWENLKDRLNAPATELQLEQQQKLCIARLIPTQPEVILMDEPCSALDVEGTRAIEELMWTLRGRYTIVIVTHNMAQARRASDESIFMLLGEIIEHRRTEDLFLNPQDPRTAEYVEGRYG